MKPWKGDQNMHLVTPLIGTLRMIQCDFFVGNGRFRYGSLSDNSEPFNGRLCDELLNETLFGSLANARATLTEWQFDCNYRLTAR
jgi:hypothetical protein